MGLKILGVGWNRRPRNVVLWTRSGRLGVWLTRATISRRVVRRSCFFGRHDGRILKCPRLGSRGDWGLAMVR